MKITVDHSPHQNERPANTLIRVIVLHADVANSAASSIAWLKNPDSRASYHVIIERNGDITQLVPDVKRAWHAGVSEYAGRKGVNDFSLGLCFSNRQDGTEAFDPRAIVSGVQWVAAAMRRHGIGLEGITTHEAIARPIGRKQDPGPLFPLAQFITQVRLAVQAAG